MIEISRLTERELRERGQNAWSLLAAICRRTPRSVRIASALRTTNGLDQSPKIHGAFRRTY